MGRFNNNDPNLDNESGVRPENDIRIEQLGAEIRTYQNSLAEVYGLYEKKVEELSLVRRIGDSIRIPLDLETLCLEIVKSVAAEIAADKLALLMIDRDSEGLSVRSVYDAGEDKVVYYSAGSTEAFPGDYLIAQKALADGEPVLFSGKPAESDSDSDTGGKSEIYLPLSARGKIEGFLYLMRRSEKPYGNDDVRVLTIIGDQAAVALANLQLFKDVEDANVRLSASEKQARQTSLYLESLLETANDVIFTLNSSGRIAYVNKKVEEWGYDKELLPGRYFTDLSADENAREIIESLLLKKVGQMIDVELATSDMERRQVLLSISHITGGNALEEAAADKGAVLVIARDVTERKELERQLIHSEKLAGVGILAAGVAHEIGNPLSAISGYAQILRSGADEKSTREYIDAIADQSTRIEHIIRDLLSYSRPSAGQSSEIYLKEEIPRIMSMVAGQGAFKNVSVFFNADDDAPNIVVDREHLAQLIINISLNAAQAMTDGGRLIISVKKSSDFAEIVIEDDGPGIPADIQDRIFDPFFSTKTAGQGAGLGLAVCHRIVETYKGSIRMESLQERGSKFIIRFPGMDKRVV